MGGGRSRDAPALERRLVGAHPIDSIEAVRDVWSDGPERAWAVGNNGLLLRWDGSRWQRVDSGERTHLARCLGSAGTIYGLRAQGRSPAL